MNFGIEIVLNRDDLNQNSVIFFQSELFISKLKKLSLLLYIKLEVNGVFMQLLIKGKNLKLQYRTEFYKNSVFKNLNISKTRRARTF